ncbi:MAG: cbb3-type cytochrome c oxidase N-terminal domain-containing protein [Gemmatimonadales bacterium]
MTQPDTKDSLLLDHEYDGIQEFDNPMPRWWLWIFYATIVYSVLYWFNVPGIGIGQGHLATYEAEMAAAGARSEELAALRTGPTDASLLAMAEDQTVLELGATTYTQMCASCHAPDGGGLIGPNLTDDYWIHGNSPLQIHLVIEEGVLAKGMPAWGAMLRPEQVDAVTAYVMTLRGTTPTNPRAPEGERVGFAGEIPPALPDSGGG